MKVELHYRDSMPAGGRLGGGRVRLESCRVYAEAGDGVRLKNIALGAYAYFHKAAMDFVGGSSEGTLAAAKQNVGM